MTSHKYMEESTIVEKQRLRKRSNSDNNAFAKFVPLASPLGDEAEAHDEGNDNNGHKRFKPNPRSNSSPCLLNKQSMVVQENHHFLSPPPSSTLTEHFIHTKPSPSSVASKTNQHLSAEKFNGKEDVVELEWTSLMACEQLSKRPKMGGIYEDIRIHRESTVQRLRELCNVEPTIDVGIEMADAASLLKLMTSSVDETIETAGKKASRGSLLLLQAEILHKNGLQLISESQNSLKDIL